MQNSELEIIITKSHSSDRLLCKRTDGTSTSSELGPNLPHHDIAHYVVETYFKLTQGFFGNIKNGRAIHELNDKEVIKTLPTESWLAEVLTRNLQALEGGSSNAEQFIELVKWEAEAQGNFQTPSITIDDVRNILQLFKELLSKWNEIRENESLILTF